MFRATCPHDGSVTDDVDLRRSERRDLLGRDERDVGAGVQQRPSVIDPLLRVRDDEASATGKHSVDAGESRRSPAEPDPGQVVPLEDRMRLHGAGRDHDAFGADPEQLVLPGDRDEGPVVDPDGGGVFQHGDVL